MTEHTHTHTHILREKSTYFLLKHFHVHACTHTHNDTQIYSFQANISENILFTPYCERAYHCHYKDNDKLDLWQTVYMNMLNQLSSVAQSCPTLCDPMNRSTPGLPVRHQLPEFTQTHVHRVSDAIQPSHPRPSPSPPAPNPSQHQSLFQ